MPTSVTITLGTLSETTVLLQSTEHLKCPTSAISNNQKLVEKNNKTTSSQNFVLDKILRRGTSDFNKLLCTIGFTARLYCSTRW